MAEILLSHPLVQLYLVYVVALFIVFMFRRPSSGPVRKEDGKRRIPEPGERFRQEKTGQELPLVREAGRSCAAEYAARYSSAIRRVRPE
jgi:hypothetical protein